MLPAPHIIITCDTTGIDLPLLYGGFKEALREKAWPEAHNLLRCNEQEVRKQEVRSQALRVWPLSFNLFLKQCGKQVLVGWLTLQTRLLHSTVLNTLYYSLAFGSNGVFPLPAIDTPLLLYNRRNDVCEKQARDPSAIDTAVVSNGLGSC